MKKVFLLCCFFSSSLLLPAALNGVEVRMSPFRLGHLVYYHVLYKLQGVPLSRFKDITVISDTSGELVFEFEGKRYTANFLTNGGAIYVTMPEGMRNRFISRSSFPAIILSDFDRR